MNWLNRVFLIGSIILILPCILLNQYTIEKFISPDQNIESPFVLASIYIVNISGLAAIIWLIATKEKTRFYKNFYSILILIFTPILFLEILIKLLLPSVIDDYLLYRIAWPKNTHTTFWPDSNILQGVYGKSEFQTSSIGVRGREINESDSIRILTVGGSTTECLYLDQSESWPCLLEKQLKDVYKNVWVGNIGRSGFLTPHHLEQIRVFPTDKYKIDLVIILVGNNDIATLLKHGTEYYTSLDYETPFYKMTASWILFERINFMILNLFDYYDNFIRDSNGVAYSKWRQYRNQASKIIHTLPDLTLGKNLYQNRLKGWCKFAEKKNWKLCS